MRRKGNAEAKNSARLVSLLANCRESGWSEGEDQCTVFVIVHGYLLLVEICLITVLSKGCLIKQGFTVEKLLLKLN